MTDAAATLEAYLDANHDRRMASYLEFLRIPSISGQQAYAADCRAAAEWVAARLRAIGAEHVEVSETEGHPIVYGDWLHAEGAPTAVVYAHYDVQPVEPLDEWDTDPFQPVVRGDRLIARGAADDKGQVQIHLCAAEAILATRGALPINLRFVFEGEEESSSVGLDAWLAANRHRLTADLAVVSDTGFFDGNLPALTISLRGLAYARIDVTGTTMDLHSGSYGGTVQNPANALAVILAGLKDPDGRVTIPGFYDDVVPLTAADRAAYAALPFDEAAYREGLGQPTLFGEVGFTTLERRSGRPTLDVNGMWSGAVGEGTMTVIPASAHAKVSCRLVAHQDPTRVVELLRAHVTQIAPPGVGVTVHDLGGGRPTLTPIDHPAMRAAARAIVSTFGREPLYIRDGGSIPVCASFGSILGLPLVMLGFAPPDDNAHAPNESMSIPNFETGIRAVAAYWDELAGEPWAMEHRGSERSSGPVIE